MPLRDYQQRAIDQLGHGSLLLSPTGTGKTVMLAVAVAERARAGRRCLWVAPRRELVGQASAALVREFLLPGVNVEVRTVQELRASPGRGPLADCLFFDEAHHLAGDDWSLLATEQYAHAELIGATATPERGDGRALSMFTRIVEAISISDAIEQGFLVPARVLRPDRPLESGQLAQEPLAAYQEHAAGKKAILFAPDVQVAIQYACVFNMAGFRARAVWGDMPEKDRELAIEKFKAGELDVLTSVNVLTEGFDVPATEVVLLARGFGSAGGYLQAVGRGLRPSPGKSECLVLDLRGCSHLHGEPDDIRSFHLDGKPIRRAGDDPNIRFCPVCGFPTLSATCEQCDYAGPMAKRKPRILGLALDRFARFQQDSDDQKARRLARWIAQGREKGHKDGAAMYRFKGVYFEMPSVQVLRQARLLAQG